jgi:hypothetical protein
MSSTCVLPPYQAAFAIATRHHQTASLEPLVLIHRLEKPPPPTCTVATEVIFGAEAPPGGAPVAVEVSLNSAVTAGHL